MNLPAGTAGNIVSVVDYTNTFQTNNLTIAPNGSQKIGGIAANIALNTEGQSVTFVYVDDTEGWKNVQDSTSNVTGNDRLCASITGACNTLTTCGNCKIATFTGPGDFIVNAISQTAADNTVSYLVVAGGGGGGSTQGGAGGGAGGFREFKGPTQSYSVSPLNGATPITVTAATFPITVGGGGTHGSPAANGNSSIFSSVTSAGGGGGGGGGGPPDSDPGAAGGSGGGGGGRCGKVAGAGNSPPVSPIQGTPGGSSKPESSPSFDGGGGGGGAAGPGGNATNDPGPGGNGGSGVSTSIAGSPTAYSGGGGGARENFPPGTGGSGGGGNGAVCGQNGTANSGGGAGGGCSNGGTGGSGVVIIRYKFQ